MTQRGNCVGCGYRHITRMEENILKFHLNISVFLLNLIPFKFLYCCRLHAEYYIEIGPSQLVYSLCKMHSQVYGKHTKGNMSYKWETEYS